MPSATFSTSFGASTVPSDPHCEIQSTIAERVRVMGERFQEVAPGRQVPWDPKPPLRPFIERSCDIVVTDWTGFHPYLFKTSFLATSGKFRRAGGRWLQPILGTPRFGK